MTTSLVSVGLPFVEPVDLVDRHDEGSLLLDEEVDALEGLGLEPVHDVHHEDGDVAQAGSTVPAHTRTKLDKKKTLKNY